MKRYFVNVYNLLGLLGFNPRKLISTCKGIPFYLRDLKTLKKQKSSQDANFPFEKLYPCLEERFSESGNATGHYFHQDLLVARRVHENIPNHHVDVGSRVDGFVAHVASFRQIEVLDIRPNDNHIHNVLFAQCNIMDELESKFIEFTDSLSCLHALEHFGLGRYGDPIKYNGYLIGLNNLQRILKKKGKFYFTKD